MMACRSAGTTRRPRVRSWVLAVEIGSCPTKTAAPMGISPAARPASATRSASAIATSALITPPIMRPGGPRRDRIKVERAGHHVVDPGFTVQTYMYISTV